MKPVQSFLFFLLASIIFLYNPKNFAQNLTKQIILDNKIKSCLEFSYKYNFGKPEKKVKESENKYDINGNNVEFIHYNQDGTISSRSVYQFDLNDCMIEEKRFNGKDNVLSCKVEKKYNVNKLCIKEIQYNSDGKKFCETYNEYNSNNLNSKTIFVNPDGSKDSVEYLYDSSEKIIAKKFYNSKSEMKKQYSYLYDNNNNLVKEIESLYIPYKSIYEKSYEYNKDGKLIKEKSGDNRVTTFKYDKGGRIIEENTKGRSLNDYHKFDETKFIYKYNKKGLLIEKTDLNKENGPQVGRIFDYEYYK